MTVFRALLKNNKYNGHYFDRQTEKTKERSSSSHVFTNSETTNLQKKSKNFICFVFLNWKFSIEIKRKDKISRCNCLSKQTKKDTLQPIKKKK